MEDQQIVNTIKLLRKWFEEEGDAYTCMESDYIGFDDRAVFNVRELAVFIESNFIRKEDRLKTSQWWADVHESVCLWLQSHEDERGNGRWARFEALRDEALMEYTKATKL